MKEDIYWIRRVKSGKKNDFSPLVKRYKDRIFSFILRMVQNEEDAMDLTQESFIKAFNGLSSFKEEKSFKNWLFTIASHHSIDFLRKKKHIKESELFESDIGKQQISQMERIIQDERIRNLNKEVELLPENYRMVILLKHKEEMKLEEIAEIMKVPIGTIKVWLHRARAQLKKKLREKDKENFAQGNKNG